MSLRILKYIRVHLKLFFVLLIAGIGFAEPVSADTQEAMTFEISVTPELQRHINMLEYPPYLALAVENIGMKLTTGSGKITILNASSLQYKTAILRYVQRKGLIYSYEASVGWDIGMTQVSFKLPIEADISALGKGKINVRVLLPLARFIPQDLINRIRLKVQSLADINLQKKMLNYFDSLQQKRKPGSGMEGVFNLILVQAHNSQTASIGGVAAREPGDAEPLSDQLLLLITLTIWLVIVPLVALGQYLWRKHRQRHASG